MLRIAFQPKKVLCIQFEFCLTFYSGKLICYIIYLVLNRCLSSLISDYKKKNSFPTCFGLEQKVTNRKSDLVQLLCTCLQLQFTVWYSHVCMYTDS